MSHLNDNITGIKTICNSNGYITEPINDVNVQKDFLFVSLSLSFFECLLYLNI